MTTRPDTVRTLSAIGAGVLLAVTPHCGGKSEGPADDSENGRGGSGNAGSGNDQGGSSGYSGAPGTGGSSGYSGAPGTGGSAGYAGTVGTGGSYGGSYGGSVPCSTALMFCFTPTQIAAECSMPDGGIDAGADTGGGGTGGPGEGGFGGEASDPPGFTCPPSPPYSCIGRPIRGVVTTTGWNGTACCYVYETDC